MSGLDLSQSVQLLTVEEAATLELANYGKIRSQAQLLTSVLQLEHDSNEAARNLVKHLKKVSGGELWAGAQRPYGSDAAQRGRRRSSKTGYVLGGPEGTTVTVCCYTHTTDRQPAAAGWPLANSQSSTC
jgi:hypothetical protein